MKSQSQEKEQKIRLDAEYKKLQEKVKEAFWGDFVFGGMIISGIFIIINNLNFSREANIIIGIVIVALGFSLIVGRLGWAKLLRFRIKRLLAQALKLSDSNLDKSLKKIEKMISLDDKLPIAYYNKGALLNNKEKYEEAIEFYEKAIKLDKDYLRPIEGKGVALEELGRFEEAIEYYKKIIELDPENQLALFRKERAEKKLAAS